MLKLSRLKNREKGRRVFILGNGPSIRQEDLSALAGELVIGMNASPLLDKEFGFTSQYYTLSDRRFLNHPIKREYATSMIDKETIRVLRQDIAGDDDSSLAGQTAYARPLQRDGFSWNLGTGFFFGCTTTMLAMQLAVFLGCRDIVLLGVDLRYAQDQPRFYAESEPQFDDPFTSVQIHNLVKAAREIESRGGRVVGCSKRSFLRTYLPYMEFDRIIHEGADRMSAAA
jgi:hypothetical protein